MEEHRGEHICVRFGFVLRRDRLYLFVVSRTFSRFLKEQRTRGRGRRTRASARLAARATARLNVHVTHYTSHATHFTHFTHTHTHRRYTLSRDTRCREIWTVAYCTLFLSRCNARPRINRSPGGGASLRCPERRAETVCRPFLIFYLYTLPTATTTTITPTTTHSLYYKRRRKQKQEREKHGGHILTQRTGFLYIVYMCRYQHY